jgi:hypothetical protein
MMGAVTTTPRLLAALLVVWLPGAGIAAGAAIPPELLTLAESSGFRATASYEQTLGLLRRLEARSPYLKLAFYGTSQEGRPLPLVVISKESAFTASEARRLSKPIVLVQNGIHAGEIDGKDASLMLARELVLGQHPEILEAVTLLVLPIYNVDGHERVSPFNRPEQDGPAEGMGFRTNATGLDLNRDHMKLASDEARAMIGLFDAWRPHLHVDNHVSDGFEHAWSLGYATAEAPQAPATVDAWVKAHLPAVAKATRLAGHAAGPYVELVGVDPAKGAITPAYRPRYSTGYYALRNRPSILVETHSHKPFAERVRANHAWLVALLSEVARDPAALVEAVAAAERSTIAAGAPGAAPSQVALRFEPDRDGPGGDSGPPDTLRHPLYDWSIATSAATGAPMATYRRGVLRETDLPWWHTPSVARSVSRPRGYVVLPGWPQIEQRLTGHGLRFAKLPAAVEMEVETLRVSSPTFAAAPYQGLTAVTSVTVTRRPEERKVPAGALWIPADQPDFDVAVQLLEPDAPDSLLSWGLLSQVFEVKEGIDPPRLDELARGLLRDPAVAAEWKAALSDPELANDPRERERWWHRHTPYWDETVGLMPVYRVLKARPAP